MNFEDEFKCLVGAYYGISNMDEYILKEYIMHDIEEYIKNFIEEHHVDNFNYREYSDKIEKEVSLKRKLQDALIILPRVDAPRELIYMVNLKIKDLEK